jgi:hypothetical protein
VQCNVARSFPNFLDKNSGLCNIAPSHDNALCIIAPSHLGYGPCYIARSHDSALFQHRAESGLRAMQHKAESTFFWPISLRNQNEKKTEVKNLVILSL